MLRIALALSLFSLAARASPEVEPPPLAQIVARAAQLVAKKPDGLVCPVEMEAEQLDSGGKKEHETRAQTEVTLRGAEQDEAVIRQWNDGKELTQRELVEQDKKRAKAKSEGKDRDAEMKEPIDQPDKFRFALLRTESLWGRPAFVLSAAPLAEGSEELKGTLWIDATSFVELKAELSPAKNPDHVDWMKVQLQAGLHSSGAVVPTLVHVEGAGHFLLFHKGFRFTQRWGECRAAPSETRATPG